MNETITLDRFKQLVRVHSGEKATTLLSKYVERFVDTTCESYKRGIEKKQRYADGEFSSGYLWDCMKRVDLISEFAFLQNIESHPYVFVLWDEHSSQKILTPDYYKFPRGSVIAAQGTVVVAGIDFFPDDIYVFDDSLDWSVIRTYTIYDDQSRICYRAY